MKNSTLLVTLIVFIAALIILLIKDVHATFYHVPHIIHTPSNIRYNETSTYPYRFYTFYSDKYKSAYDQMMGTFKDTSFQVEPVVVDQKVMEQCFNNHEKMFYDYRWRGCSIKIDILIDCIQKNKGEYILFTDSDLIFLKPIGGVLDYYREQEYDLVLTEACVMKFGEEYCVSTGANIGVLFMRCNNIVLAFFQNIKTLVENNEWDEGVTKKQLSSSNLRYTLFPASIISTQYAHNPDSHVVKIIGSYLGIDKAEYQKKILQ
jgi:hypothetical protein